MSARNFQTVTGFAGQTFDVIAGLEAPHSIEAEERLLAGVLADQTGEAWAVALNCGMKAKAFYRPAAQIVWQVVSELRQAGQANLDLALLVEELKLRGQLEAAGGVPGLAQMTESATTSISVRYYAEVVVLLWEMRHAVKMAGELRESAMEFDTREVFAAKAAQVGQRLIGLGRKARVQTMAEEIGEAKEHVMALAEGRFDKSRLVRTGLAEFDQKCGEFGIGGGDDKFIVVGGGSGHGKSVLVRQIAQATLEAGQRVLAYTREQSVGDFALLMASAAMGYDLALAETQPKDRTAAFGSEVDRIMANLADKRLFAYSHQPATPLVTIEDLCEHARAWCHLHGVPELIVVDYLQMFDSRKRFNNSEARVGHIAYALQALQRELGCVMVVAAQLNEAGLAETRNAKKNEDGKLIHNLPHRGWVRDSQQIYHAADRMIFLYVPPETSDGMSQTEPGLTRLEVWLYQEKRRKGRTGHVKTTFEKSFVRFVSGGRKAPVAPPAATGQKQAGAVVSGVKISKEQFKGEAF